MSHLAVLLAEGPGVDMNEGPGFDMNYATMNVWIETRHSVLYSLPFASDMCFLGTDIRRSIGIIQRLAAESRLSIKGALKEIVK